MGSGSIWELKQSRSSIRTATGCQLGMEIKDCAIALRVTAERNEHGLYLDWGSTVRTLAPSPKVSQTE